MSRKGLLRPHRIRVDRRALRFLVDAHVLSEPTRAQPEPRVLEWLREHEREMVADPIILGEVRYAILLLAGLRKRGTTMPIKDSMIAATALTHDLVVVTRNRVDFERAGVEICDPFGA